VTTCSGGLLLGSFDSDDQGVEPLLEDLGVGGQKGDDVRCYDDLRRGGGGDMNSTWVVAPRGCSTREYCSTAAVL
jgi:hypothetical protein